nr:putative nucleotidyltransferase, Ribonuclease H [Ipomoea batatas]
MLRKDSFHWSQESERAFDQLKHALCHSHVLALPDFQREFVVEEDASYRGMGAVLVQEGRPVVFLVEYLGHIFSQAGLQTTDPTKLEVVASWPKPRTVKALRGFLGLAGESERAFDQLKHALCHSHVLALPDFQREFVVEEDASYRGMGSCS